jgi:RNA polymerase sigma factor (sigma-70 family)
LDAVVAFPAGFDEFFDDHYAPVVRALALAVGDRGRAEDAAQEAFARAFRRWRTVEAMERPMGWVYVVAMNVLRREWRRSADHRSAAPGAGSGVCAWSADERLVGGDHGQRVADTVSVRAAIAELAPRQRAVIVLRFLCDLSIAEVAEALHCSVGTVKSNQHDALRRLRVELDELDDDDRGTDELEDREVPHAH